MAQKDENKLLDFHILKNFGSLFKILLRGVLVVQPTKNTP